MSGPKFAFLIFTDSPIYTVQCDKIWGFKKKMSETVRDTRDGFKQERVPQESVSPQGDDTNWR